MVSDRLTSHQFPALGEHLCKDTEAEGPFSAQSTLALFAGMATKGVKSKQQTNGMMVEKEGRQEGRKAAISIYAPSRAVSL